VKDDRGKDSFYDKLDKIYHRSPAYDTRNTGGNLIKGLVQMSYSSQVLEDKVSVKYPRAMN
jgi:hypothetical protein